MPRGRRPSRSAPAGPTSIAPRPRWSRFTTALAALAGIAVVLTGGATAAHADPSVAEIERQIDARLEQARTDHRTAQRHPRRTSPPSASRPTRWPSRSPRCSARSTPRWTRSAGWPSSAYKGDNVSTVNALLGSRSPSEVVGQPRNARPLRAPPAAATCSAVADLRDQLAAQKAPLDEMVAQLTRTEAQLAAKKKQINAEIDRLQKLRLKVYGNGGGGPLRPAPCPASYPGGAGGQAVKFACAQIGKPYVWGAEGPNSYDCSGLTLAAWAQGRRVAAAQRRAQQPASPSASAAADLRPGDLVFYYSDMHHVGMYVGGGWVVHASQAGKPVKMKKVDDGQIHSYGRPG